MSLKIQDIREFVVWWNNNFPIDLWWRKKHGVLFNSIEHRNSCFIDMICEFEEEKLINKYSKERKRAEEDEEDYLITGRWMRRHFGKSSKDEIDNWMSNMGDLKHFDTPVKNKKDG